MRILIVDDDAHLRQMYRDILESHDVQEADNGIEALEYVLASISEESRIDLIITDKDMPRLDGIELKARLNRAGIFIPMIMVTGGLTVTERARILEQHAFADVLAKPFDIVELQTAIVAACMGHQWVNHT